MRRRMRSGRSEGRGWRRWTWPARSAVNASRPPRRARRDARHVICGCGGRIRTPRPGCSTSADSWPISTAPCSRTPSTISSNRCAHRRASPGTPGTIAPPTRWSSSANAPRNRVTATSRHRSGRPSRSWSVEVPLSGPATVAGIPLPDAVVEQLRANAIIEPVLVDDHGAPLLVGRRFSGLSEKIARAVLLRDGHCRCGTCDLRYGLHIHHLVPAVLGWQRRHLQPRRGVHRRRPSPDAHTERSLGPGRQPQPARRLTPRPLRGSHRRRSPRLRAPATLTGEPLTAASPDRTSPPAP